MRTNIVIDDELLERAMALSGLKTKREAVELGQDNVVVLRAEGRAFCAGLDLNGWQRDGETGPVHQGWRTQLLIAPIWRRRCAKSTPTTRSAPWC